MMASSNNGQAKGRSVWCRRGSASGGDAEGARGVERCVRASPRVCQNLLGKSCVLPTSKKLCKVKKRIHLQQFGIIHLPNPDLTYIRNPERNKIMYVPFHLLKNLHQESFSILYFFFTLPPRGKQRSTRAYMRVGR
jgi:hypothetical protein